MKADSEMCLRVARHLSARSGHGEVVCHIIEDAPERTVGSPPGAKFVDLSTVSADESGMALEHTIIESYAQQLHEARQIEALLRPLEERLAGQLPDGSYFELMVGYGAVFDPTLDADVVLASVEPWVRAVAPTLKNGSGWTAPHHYESSGPPETAVELSLYRWATDAPEKMRRLYVGRSQADDREAQYQRRVQRLAKALDDKLLKFERYSGLRSVLVLEDVDISTPNLPEVVSALKVAATGRTLCDTIVVAQTGFGADTATVVFEGGTWVEQQERLPI